MKEGISAYIPQIYSRIIHVLLKGLEGLVLAINAISTRIISKLIPMASSELTQCSNTDNMYSAFCRTT